VSSADARLAASWRLPFAPLFRDPHLQTIVGRYWPARLDENTRPTRPYYFSTEPSVKVLGHYNTLSLQRPPAASVDAEASAATNPAGMDADATAIAGETQPLLIAVHGLTASSDAPYMRTLAQRALTAGFDVLRLNVRNCGGTEHLSPTLYHSGLTGDLRAVVEQLAPRPILLAGFSMGGNMVLKLAGEWGESPPPHVLAVCGISVPIHLGVCARKLGERVNRIYEVRFLRELRRTVLRKRQLMPEAFGEVQWDRIRTIYDFDDAITAPAFGFRDADHYYESASSAGFLEKIRIPALLIQAQDDPFIPFEVFAGLPLEKNPHVYLEAPPHGGHVAFLAKGTPRFWAIEQTVRFFGAVRRNQD
jgi:predicted alpha/beta-fold hydrolase